MVRIAVFLPRLTSDWKLVEFLVDTGTEATTLHPTDAVYSVGIDQTRLSLPYMWPDTAPSYGIGGAVEDYIELARYRLLHDDGAEQTITGQIRIAQPTMYNRQFPSLVGWNILQHFRLVVDRRAGEVLLL